MPHVARYPNGIAQVQAAGFKIVRCDLVGKLFCVEAVPV